MEWWAKVIVKIGGNDQNEAKSILWTFGLLKYAATLDIASPDTRQCLKLPFKPFISP